MERGLYELDQQSTSLGNEHFEKGRNDMQNLIQSSDFTKAYRYSVHAYVNLIIKHAIKNRTKLSNNECIFIADVLKSALENSYDTRLKEINEKFIRYCDNNDIGRYTRELKVYQKKYAEQARDEDYDVGYMDSEF